MVTKRAWWIVDPVTLCGQPWTLGHCVIDPCIAARRNGRVIVAANKLEMASYAVDRRPR
jgi:hypothetical protein